MQCDPVEKKPFFHAYPGALAYSFGMLGCDLHCGYCQNWVTSQALRDPEAIAPPRDATPASLVADARRQGARLLVSTYNEPLITAEWAIEIFREARAAGLVTGFVSNGNGTTRVLEYIRPHIDLYKVDLKSFDDRRYRELGGRLAPILDTIQWLHDAGVWVEIVTLLVPGFNDGESELRALTAFLAGVSPDVPWHVTAFHQDYKMTDPANTTPAMLLRAARIGQEAGLRATATSFRSTPSPRTARVRTVIPIFPAGGVPGSKARSRHIPSSRTIARGCRSSRPQESGIRNQGWSSREAPALRRQCPTPTDLPSPDT